jgi:hypothetical protein
MLTGNSRKTQFLFDRDQGAEPPMGGARLTVHVTIEPGDDLSGCLVADPGKEALAFSGWLGLIEAINLLRRRAGHVVVSTPVSAGSDADGPG